MKSQITKTIGRNIFYSFATMAWTLLLGFLITPYILRFLGNERYGIWGIVLSAAGVATFFDLGLGSALVLYVADKRVRQDPDETNALINSATTLYLAFGLLGGLCLAGGGTVLTYHLLKISPAFQKTAASIFLIYGFLFAVQMPAKVYEDVLIGMQRLDITNKIGICIRTAERLLVFFLLMKGIGFLTVVWVSGFLGLSLYLIEFLFVKRLFPEHRPRLRLRKRDVKDLFSTGGQQFVASLGYIFLGTIDRFLLGSLLHVKFVTFYDLASRPSQLLHQVGARFFLPLYPASADLKARQEGDRLRALFKKGTKLLFVLLAPLALAIFLWSMEIMHFWLGPGYELSGQMLKILTLNYFILGLNEIPNAMMFGLNKAWLISLESVLRVVLNLILSFLFISRLGAVGAAYGLILSSLATSLPFFWLMAKAVGIREKELFFEILLFPLAVSFLGGVFFFSAPLLHFSVGLRFTVFIIFFLGASLTVYIGRSELLNLMKAVFVRSEG